MSEHLLQAVGKTAGISGIALGIFLLLFREVIRKNIFPKLSDDEAYRLIRQFMYLTFGMALAGIVAWVYITVVTFGGGTGSMTQKLLKPAKDIAGTWTADVKYGWGDTYTETFTFEINGHDLSGLATYVKGPNPLSNGIVDGDQIRFQTASYTEMNDKQYQEKHMYKGKMIDDTIEFVLQTDSGYSSVLPIKFTARRKV